uniref:ACT domain-containing protein n=1 Tax=Thermofilum pendens TaxID=2269 RepID=A0A7C1P1A6_THEPE
MRGGQSLVKIAQKLILAMPYVLEAMKLDIVNYASLARLLKPDMEKLAGRPLKEGAVKVAVLRAAKSLLEDYPPPDRLSRALTGGELRIVQGLAALSIPASKRMELLELLSSLRGDEFVQVAQGLSAITLILKEKTAESLLARLGSQDVLQFLRDQAAVIITGSPDILVTPGVVSALALSLSSRGINLTEVLSSYRDIIFVMSRTDSAKALEVLRNLLEVLRHRSGT